MNSAVDFSLQPAIGIAANECKNNALSKREQECLFYVSRGCIMKEISQHMGISPRTVESYIENIKIKIGLRRRSSLVRRNAPVYSPLHC